MKPLPFREVKRRLEAAGFAEAGQTGSHVKFAKTTAAGTRTAQFLSTMKSPPGHFAVSCVKQDSPRTSSTHSSTIQRRN